MRVPLQWHDMGCLLNPSSMLLLHLGGANVRHGPQKSGNRRKLEGSDYRPRLEARGTLVFVAGDLIASLSFCCRSSEDARLHTRKQSSSVEQEFRHLFLKRHGQLAERTSYGLTLWHRLVDLKAMAKIHKERRSSIMWALQEVSHLSHALADQEGLVHESF